MAIVRALTRVFNPLKNIVASTVFDLDASWQGVYPPSGQLWKNQEPIPADGSAQTAYDFTRGLTSNPETDDPTFNGNVNELGAYWSFDGLDLFQLAGANTTFLNNLHKTTGGTAFWAAFMFRHVTVSTGTNPVLFSTRNIADVGFQIRTLGSSNKLQLSQRGNTAEVVGSDTNYPAFIGGKDYIVIVSVPAGGGTAKVWIDNAIGVNSTITYNTTTASAGQVAHIGGKETTTRLRDQTRLKHLSMGNSTLTDAQAKAIRLEIEDRHLRPVATMGIAGQSNADGADLLTNISSRVSTFYDTARPLLSIFYKPAVRAVNNTIEVASFADNGQIYRLDKRHNDTDKVTHQCIGDAGSTVAIASGLYAGIELPLAQKFAERNPGEKLMLLKCAVAGSDIDQDWAITAKTTNFIYDFFLRFIYWAAIREMRTNNERPDFIGFYWMQGESNLGNASYQGWLQDLVDNLKEDLWHVPEKIVIGGMSAAITGANKTLIAAQQLAVSLANNNTVFMPLDGSDFRPAAALINDDIHHSQLAMEDIAERVYSLIFPKASDVFITPPARAYTPLKSLVSSTLCDLSANLSDSYGAGQQWNNLTGIPADGSPTDAYRFVRGLNSIAAADDPTFSGRVNKQNAYFHFDGAEFFTLEGANTSFLKNLNKTTGGQAFWLSFAFRYIDISAGTNPVLFTTRNFFGQGITLRVTGGVSDRIELTQRGNTAEAVLNTAGLPVLVGGTYYGFVISVPAGGGTCKMFQNSLTPVTGAITYNTSTSDAAQKATIGYGFENLTHLPLQSRLTQVGFGNSELSDAQAAAILGQYEARDGTDYTL